MKSISSSRSLAFLLFLFMLPAASFAASNSKEVTFDKTTKVGTTDLAPGTYKVAWNGTGASANVDFSQGKKVVASTTAKLETNESGNSFAVSVQTADSGPSILQKIDYKTTELVFSAENAASGN